MSDKSGTRHCEVWACTDIISMWSFDCGRRKEVKNKEKLRYGVWNRWFARMSSQTAQSHRLPPMQILCQHAESHLANVPQKKHRWPPVSLCRGLACQESDFKWQCVHTWAQAKDFCIIVCTFSLSDLPKLHISARTVVLLEYRPFSTHWYSKWMKWVNSKQLSDKIQQKVHSNQCGCESNSRFHLITPINAPIKCLVTSAPLLTWTNVDDFNNHSAVYLKNNKRLTQRLLTTHGCLVVFSSASPAVSEYIHIYAVR